MISGPLTHHSVACRLKGFRRALFDANRLANPDYEVTLDPGMEYGDAARSAATGYTSGPRSQRVSFAISPATDGTPA